MRGNFWKSKILVAVVIGLFSLMVLAEDIPSTESLYSRLMAQGKEFYENGELNQAAAKYQSAQAVAANKEEMAEAYFLLALTYYVLVDMDNCQISLENYFSISAARADPLLGKNLPPRFADLFKSQKKEYLQKMAGMVAPSAQVQKVESQPQPQPTVRERETTAPQVKKKKKFPWLLVIFVTLVAGAAVYYFVVLNKKYTLTTNVGTGVNGTPTAGSIKYKNGSVVNYNYSIASGYTNLVVALDGTPVAASGTVKMDKNHTLSATASESFVLTVTKNAGVDGTPETGTYTYARGTLVNYNYTPASGYSDLVVKIDNVAVAASGTITMNANHTLTAEVTDMFTLTVLRYEGVNGNPATGTTPYKKGTEVNYSYTKKTGYTDLHVTLDGTAVDHSGTVTMNANHKLVSYAYFTLTVPIRADNLDCTEDTTFLLSGDTTFKLDWVGTATNILAGYVFSDVRIPKGAPIINSYISFRGFGYDSNATIRFIGFSEDNANLFYASGSNKPSTRPTTTEFVNYNRFWPFAWTWFDSPNLSNIVTEVITRPGWNFGNNIGFKITNPNGTGSRIAITDYANNPTNVAKLIVTYSTRISTN